MFDFNSYSFPGKQSMTSKISKLILSILFVLSLIGCEAVSFEEIEINPENLAQPAGIEGRWIISMQEKEDTSALVRAANDGAYELLIFEANSKEKLVIYPFALISNTSNHNFIVLFGNPDNPDSSLYFSSGLLEVKSDDVGVYYLMLEKNKNKKNREISRYKWTQWMKKRYGLPYKESKYGEDVSIIGANAQILRTILNDPIWEEYVLTRPIAEITRMPKDHVDQVGFDKALAKSGDAVAQYNLGTMYFKGEGVAVNTHLAIQWLEKAALQDHTDAKKMLKRAREISDIDRRLAEIDQERKVLERLEKFICGSRRCDILEGRRIYRSRVSPHWWYWPDGSIVRREDWPDE
jgi:Sel1 repeat-containing protein